jgi:predicted dehydrogenase
MSSSVERARKFARRYGIAGAYSYEQFEDLGADLTVGAAYLALPVGLHRKFTEKSAAAGKHVLCEKPMAGSVEDAEAMIAACATTGRQLMIAYRLDYDPMHAEVERLLAEGALGKVTNVTSAFGIVAKRGWRFDPRMAGGGSLFDVGVYPVHAIQRFFGDAVVESAAIKTDAATGMELDAVWQGSLANGARFACRSSYVERVPDALRIEGELGWLVLEQAFAYERTELKAELRDASGVVTKIAMKDAKGNASLFRLEAEHLAACVRDGVALRSPGEAGLRDLRTVQAIETIALRQKL